MEKVKNLIETINAVQAKLEAVKANAKALQMQNHRKLLGEEDLAKWLNSASESSIVLQTTLDAIR